MGMPPTGVRNDRYFVSFVGFTRNRNRAFGGRACSRSVGSLLAGSGPPETAPGDICHDLDELHGFHGLRHVHLEPGGKRATDVETLLDISGLPRLLALRRLRDLVERGIVAFASRVQPRP